LERIVTRNCHFLHVELVPDYLWTLDALKGLGDRCAPTHDRPSRLKQDDIIRPLRPCWRRLVCIDGPSAAGDVPFFQDPRREREYSVPAVITDMLLANRVAVITGDV
jgi:hypothetical protein